MFTYDEAKQFVIEALTQDTEKHRSGSYSSVGDKFNEYDANLPRSADPEFRKLHVALNFWDGWQDARNHDWHFYEGIQESDWPNLAELIVSDVASDREIADVKILRHFDVRPNAGVLERIKSLLFSRNTT